MLDYKLKQNRRELFIRWYAWSLEYKDCDTGVWLSNYLNTRYDHNVEQKFWFAWLYGNTYHLPTAWVLLNEFPDYELATYDRIFSWNNVNYRRLRYQTDTKYEKGKLPEKFLSYSNALDGYSQKEFFENLYIGTPKENFDNIWNHVMKNFFRFGRYSTWFYLQQLYSTCDLDITPTSLMLNDYSGSKSHRNGLLLALGMDDKYDEKLSKFEYETLEYESFDILSEMVERFPKHKIDINPFTMETCLCSFKKIFRVKHGRYLGYYLDRQSEEIMQLESDGWVGIDWDVLWQARTECLDSRLLGRNLIQEYKFSEFSDTFKISRLNWIFDDENELKHGLESFMV